MLQNKPAFRKRIAALLIDYLIILCWMAALGALSLVLFLITGGYPDYLGMLGPIGTQMLFFGLLTLPVGIYLYKTETGARHATFGKRKIGLRVEDISGGTLTKRQILVRTIVKLIPWEIAHTFVWQLQYAFYINGYDAVPDTWILVGLNGAMLLAGIYIVMVALRRDGRGPHDILAGTRVISAKKG